MYVLGAVLCTDERGRRGGDSVRTQTNTHGYIPLWDRGLLPTTIPADPWQWHTPPCLRWDVNTQRADSQACLPTELSSNFLFIHLLCPQRALIVLCRGLRDRLQTRVKKRVRRGWHHGTSVFLCLYWHYWSYSSSWSLSTSRSEHVMIVMWWLMLIASRINQYSFCMLYITLLLFIYVSTSLWFDTHVKIWNSPEICHLSSHTCQIFVFSIRRLSNAYEGGGRLSDLCLVCITRWILLHFHVKTWNVSSSI